MMNIVEIEAYLPPDGFAYGILFHQTFLITLLASILITILYTNRPLLFGNIIRVLNSQLFVNYFIHFVWST
jgi:hypothetical protein